MIKFLMLLALLGGIIFAVLHSEGHKSVKSEIKTIKEIYACDKYAECSVRFEDGTFNQRVVRPIIGTSFKCITYSTRLEVCSLYKEIKWA